jgi:hypothetical protein
MDFFNEISEIHVVANKNGSKKSRELKIWRALPIGRSSAGHIFSNFV